MSRTLVQEAKNARTMRVSEAIAAYRIGKTKLFRLMKDGTLPSRKVGGTRLIPIDALEALTMPPSAEQPQS